MNQNNKCHHNSNTGVPKTHYSQHCLGSSRQSLGPETAVTTPSSELAAIFSKVGENTEKLEEVMAIFRLKFKVSKIRVPCCGATFPAL